ncbi:MAG: pantoate--beta-alanine ligase [Vicingaceae bacterium]
MGALHNGHLSLIDVAKQQADVAICSIFVNPKQFNNPDDLKNYPIDTENDLTLLKNKSCDIVFLPTYEDIYFDDHINNYDLGGLDTVLEGKFRPGHFKGVAAVIDRFFNMVQPDKAFFGKKDYQQYLIVKQLTKKLNLPVEIIGVETYREQNGLAASSRNRLIPVDFKKYTGLLYDCLIYSKKNIKKLSVDEIKQEVLKRLNNSPFKIEYFEIVDGENLTAVEQYSNHHKIVACIAAYLGKVRLIDNMTLIG